MKTQKTLKTALIFFACAALAFVHCAKSDKTAVMQAKDALAIGYADGDSMGSVTKKVTLPTKGSDGVTITWASSPTGIISTDGTVTRPKHADVTVTLTATLTKGSESDTRVFMLNFPSAFVWSKVMTSGTLWSARRNHTAVVFNDKMWVLGGGDSNRNRFDDVWSSSDGQSWTNANARGPMAGDPHWPARNDHAVVTFDGKMWVLGGTTARGIQDDVWWSSDGEEWTKAADDAGWPRQDHAVVTFEGRIWVLGGLSGADYLNDVWRSDSSDGASWREVTDAAGWRGRRGHVAVTFDDKIWVLGGYDGSNYFNDVWWSENGFDWTQVTVSGTHWSARTDHAVATFDGKIWVMGGFRGSADGTEDTFFNDVWWSSDGANWTKLDNRMPHWSHRWGHTMAVLGDKMFLLGGVAKVNDADMVQRDVWVYQQTDRRSEPTDPDPDPDTNPDPDPSNPPTPTTTFTWSKVTTSGTLWSARRDHAALTFNGKMWVLGGATGSIIQLNDVWSSEDGQRWMNANARGPAVEPATDPVTYRSHWSKRAEHAAVVLGDKIWVLGGIRGNRELDDVWSSEDGTEWTQTTVSGTHWSARGEHAAVVFDGKMWVLGGSDGSTYFNDVWWSNDGENWTNANARGPAVNPDADMVTYRSHWSPRGEHTAVVLDDKIWVLGGGSVEADITYFNDVWWSSDGVNWTEATNAAGWPARERHAAVVFDNKIWVLGGTQNAGNQNDVWRSADGTTWEKLANGMSHWSRRENHAAVVLDDKIWLMGGFRETGGRAQDVWVSQEANN